MVYPHKEVTRSKLALFVDCHEPKTIEMNDEQIKQFDSWFALSDHKPSTFIAYAFRDIPIHVTNYGTRNTKR